MAFPKNHLSLFLFHLALLDAVYSNCPKSFECGHLGTLEFPFSNSSNSGCGLVAIDGCDSGTPAIKFGDEDGPYCVNISGKISTNKFLVNDSRLQFHLNSQSCFSFKSLSLPQSASLFVTVSPNLTMFRCYDEFYSPQRSVYFQDYQLFNCTLSTVYYRFPDIAEGNNTPPRECSVIQLPIRPGIRNSPHPLGVFDVLTAQYTLEWNVSEECYQCHHGGGKCLSNSNGVFHCKKGIRRTLILSISIGGGGFLFLLSLLVSFVIWQRKRRNRGNYLLSRNMSLEPSSRSDIEGGSFYYGIPVFSYKELQHATNNFDPTKELGDGGFGTVYYGKLGDGREVAIKRLYEHNYKRVEQFMNEIKILTCLRHPNLVSLYGCTSRTSRELLLVYEYIPNGTVADHLHGERAKDAPLTWPVRLSIAIETATALAYLHKSDIIHRDVKTNNILLDANFCVKVADFGLSRLFPNDVTHISTAPQGTPGYVDPEYHQCYQLTDRSDVYSFGVVLIELISSMPAVDISRHRHEINLANLAVDRIQRCAFDELIDSSLGYETDPEVMRMTTTVAELAFRCLQLDKDMRPSMDEVLAFLKDIQAGEDCNNCGGNGKMMVPHSPETDDVVLLKNNNFQASPNAVTDAWVSGSSTTTTTTTTSSIG